MENLAKMKDFKATDVLSADDLNVIVRNIRDMGKILYPIGSIYMSVNSANPSALFGGSWEQWGLGRVPVGINMHDTEFNSVERTGGSKNAVIVEHTHITAEAGVHRHRLYTDSGAGSGQPNRGDPLQYANNTEYTDKHTMTENGNHAHNVLAPTDSVKGTNANLQPYIVCYMWKRIA